MSWKRPTIDTLFHIDWDWWQANDRNYRLFLYEQLCEDCRRRFPDPLNVDEVDWIDPRTAEVERADALQMCLRTRCIHEPGFINESLPVAAAVFRVFLMNGNQPASASDLHRHLPWRQPETILRVIADREIRYGIRALR